MNRVTLISITVVTTLGLAYAAERVVSSNRPDNSSERLVVKKHSRNADTSSNRLNATDGKSVSGKNYESAKIEAAKNIVSAQDEFLKHIQAFSSKELEEIVDGTNDVVNSSNKYTGMDQFAPDPKGGCYGFNEKREAITILKYGFNGPITFLKIDGITKAVSSPSGGNIALGWSDNMSFAFRELAGKSESGIIAKERIVTNILEYEGGQKAFSGIMSFEVTFGQYFGFAAQPTTSIFSIPIDYNCTD